MIFSSQLGKLDGKTSEQAVKTIANHLRKIQEELEYRLSNLDSTNVTEIDTNETKLSGALVELISETEGQVAQLTLTAREFLAEVQNVEGNYSSLSQKVNGISGTVSNIQTGMSTMLKMDSTGVYIVDQNGKQVTISGGQINAQGLVITSANLPADVAKKSDIPTSVSDLDNDSGFTSLSAVQSYISRQGYENATGIVEIIEGTVNADFINALGVRARYLDGDVITVNSGSTTYAFMYAGKNTVDTTAFEIYGTNGLRLTAGGNIFLESSGGQQLVLGNDICQLSGGPLCIGADSYGPLADRPSSGTWGQLYFVVE